MAKKQATQSAWSEVPDEVLTPMPPIEVKSTFVTPTDDRVSTGARRIINAAKRAGWTVLVTYSRGPYIGAAGQFLRMSDSILVRGAKRYDDDPDHRLLFAAAWVDGSSEFAYFGPNTEPPTRMGVSDLKGRLA